MKKNIFTLLSICLAFSSFGQFSSAVLDFNNVSARVTDGGTLFQDEAIGAAAYEIPKGSGISAIYNSAFWFAGNDASGTLRMSATTFASSADMFPGPISSTGMYTDAAYIAKYSPAIWSVTQAEIDNHIAMWWQGGYVMPASIVDWPGNGDVALGVAAQLAPYVDINNNNLYEPALGEYPYIRGDKATYIISNDMAGVHTNSGGEQMGIENHVMLYQYATNDYLNDVTFVNAHVFNRGPHSYADFKCTFNNDLDLGNYTDDFVGCDSIRNMVYAYNGDNLDEDNVTLGYGADVPTIGIITLNDQLDGSGYFTNTLPYPYNDPNDVTSYWNYMNNSWADGSEWVVGGTGAAGSPGATTAPTSYLLSGDPNVGGEWSELSSGNTPGDRRIFMNMGSVSLPAQSDHCYEFAIVYSRETGNNNIQNVTSLKANADLAQAFYDSQGQFSCDIVVLGNKEIIASDFNIYPNPSNGSFNITLNNDFKEFDLTIRDMAGRLVQESHFVNQSKVNINTDVNSGVYLVTVKSNNTSTTKRIIVE